MTRGRIVLAVILAGILLWLLPPLHQHEDYHHFADQRTLLEIPNFWNVVSNAPFAIVGLLGLIALGGAASRILFAGVFLTAFGSAYYHLAPDDARLVWDRLPMTIVFMTPSRWSLTNVFARSSIFPALLTAGIASVLWWQFTGNLWPYVFVQFVPMLAIPILLRSVPAFPDCGQ